MKKTFTVLLCVIVYGLSACRDRIPKKGIVTEKYPPRIGNTIDKEIEYCIRIDSYDHAAMKEVSMEKYLSIKIGDTIITP